MTLLYVTMLYCYYHHHSRYRLGMPLAITLTLAPTLPLSRLKQACS